MATHYKAILVGNSVFPEDPHGLMQLKGPVNDVTLLQAALTNPEKGLFEAQDVITLINAKAREILFALEKFYAQARNTDQLLFYYSGHGCKDDMDSLYLCGSDTIHDHLVSTAISDKLINTMLENSSSKKNIIILDCCNSGNFKNSELPQSLQGEGRFVITSSHANQLSRDTEQKDAPSPFTKYLAEALLTDNIDTNADGFISINEVYDYVFPRLVNETKQRPQRKFSDTVGDLALCKRNIAVTHTEEYHEHKTINLGKGKPKLNVSEQFIEHKNVGYSEKLSDEIIDVFNEGSGELDWVATTEFDWIELEHHDTYIKVKFVPKVGMNRGSIRIKDKNSGSAKTIRIAIERLEKVQEVTEVEEVVTEQLKETKSVLLSTFENVSMRNPNQATTTVDNSEQKGKLIVFSNRIEFRGTNRHKITNITDLAYYPQKRNPGFTYNYMGITGSFDGVEQTKYFYSFSWLGDGPTWKMTEQIFSFISAKKLEVATNFSSHLEQPPQQGIYLPGNWNIAVYQHRQHISTMHLAFHPQGGVQGHQMANQVFSQIGGTWGFNPTSGLLTYSVMVQFPAGAVPDNGSVRLQQDSLGNITGIDHLHRQWVFQKNG